jgi:DNA topoisomerase-1
MQGKYGPYVKWDKVNATLPKDVTPEAVTLDQAVELLAAKAPAKGKAKKAAAPKAAKATTKAAKPAAKKAPAKKAAPKAKAKDGLIE